MSYQAYPIYNLATGKVTAREPWLLPKDAFETLINCHLRRGVLEKRKGYTEFGRIVHTNTATGEDSNPAKAVMGIYNHYQDDVETMLAMDTVRINKYNSSAKAFEDLTRMKIHVKSGGGQNHLPSAGDVIEGVTSGAYATVEAVITDHGDFVAGTADGTIILKNTTVNGSFQDGETLRDKNNVTDIFGVADGAASEQEFTGEDNNFFWLECWNNVSYITNGKDQIQKYTGSGLSRLYIDLDVEGGPDNDVNTCLLIFSYKGRLVLLRTTERGEPCYRRARWCQINNPGIWKEADYVDAPTEDWIMAADFIGEDLIVFFERSIWKLAYTYDADLPFRWEKIVSTEGCYAPFSLVSFSDELVGVGPTRLIGTDGRDAYGLDEKIPDEMLNWNQLAVDYCYGLVLEEESQTWTSFVPAGEEKPSQVLVNNYEDDNWSVYKLPVHTMGYSSLDSDIVLDDIDESIALDDIDYSFDDKELQAGYPTTLLGGRDGVIYQLNHGGTDNGEPIEFEAVSGRWNPYVEEGHKARLGWIDFLVDADEAVSFDVSLYLDTDTAPYNVVTVTCEPDSSLDSGKTWKRVFCGAVGMFHRIKISNNAANNRPRIHAIIPYFDRAGRVF